MDSVCCNDFVFWKIFKIYFYFVNKFSLMFVSCNWELWTIDLNYFNCKFKFSRIFLKNFWNSFPSGSPSSGFFAFGSHCEVIFYQQIGYKWFRLQDFVLYDSIKTLNFKNDSKKSFYVHMDWKRSMKKLNIHEQMDHNDLNKNFSFSA